MSGATGKEQALLQNIEKLHSTELGAARIKRNLGLADGDVVEWCREKIMNDGAAIERRGKNWYVQIEGIHPHGKRRQRHNYYRT